MWITLSIFFIIYLYLYIFSLYFVCYYYSKRNDLLSDLCFPFSYINPFLHQQIHELLGWVSYSYWYATSTLFTPLFSFLRWPFLWAPPFWTVAFFNLVSPYSFNPSNMLVRFSFCQCNLWELIYGGWREGFQRVTCHRSA